MASLGARHILNGVIASAGFASGDRIVVGSWRNGPLGPMNDVMWGRPDGSRVLLAPTQRIADFISAVYAFDEVRVQPVHVTIDQRDRRLILDADALHMELNGGGYLPFPPARLRPPWFTRVIENPIARMTMNVRTFGVTPRGIHEWYRVDGLRFVITGRASLEGKDLGALGPIDPPLQMGVSDPPKRPSIVRVRPLLQDPSGALDRLFH